MSLVVPNVGDVLMLKYIVNALGQGGGSAPTSGERLLRLFKNNLTPGKSTVIGDLTEATEAGYTSTTLQGSNWTFSSLGGVNTANYNEQTFSFTTGVTVYGYYVTTTEGSPNLLWVERFSTAPYIIPSGGGEIAITPKFSLD